MNFELFRLDSFKKWAPFAPISKERLAKGGFFYTGKGYKVQCFKCDVIIENWDYGDQVILRHREESPTCPFILNENNSGNVSHLEVNKENLKEVSVRLKTFQTWPCEHIVKARDLATAGFYYLNVGDETKCIYCSGVCMKWNENDDPKTVHKSAFPKCKMVEAFMEIEEYRELSFANWPKSDIMDSGKLAKAGLYFLEKGDSAKCFSCGGVLEQWQVGDDPDLAHRMHYPNCKYVKEVIIPRLNGLDNHQTSNGRPAQVDLPNQTTAVASEHPANPEFVDYESRLNSFENWPTDLEQKPSDLADAGFFYAGKNDLVKCFQCNGGLSQWHKDDIPWIEHAKWFQCCSYVRITKTNSFIENCLSKRGAESSISDFWNSHETSEALKLDINPDVIRKAIIEQVKEFGWSFRTAEELIDKALNLQVECDSEEDNKSEVNNSEVQELFEENRALREAKLCKICMDVELQIVFLPCAHFATCDKCSMLVNECPICRSHINNRLKTYLS